MTKPDVSITTQMVIPQNALAGTEVAQYALRYLGYQYTLTGNSPLLGFSCIGFVSYVYQSLGIPVPDDLWNARAYAPAIPFSDLRPGDIVWFGDTVWSGLSHTGIYLGHGRFVHAAWYNLGVIVSSFHGDPRYGDYWTAHYLGASRPWGGEGSRTPSFGATLARYLSPPTLDAVLQGGAVVVDAPAQRLHQWWSLQAPVVQVVAQATPLIPLQRSGNWYQVITPDGTSGWVVSASRLPLLAGEASFHPAVAQARRHLGPRPVLARHSRTRARYLSSGTKLHHIRSQSNVVAHRRVRQNARHVVRRHLTRRDVHKRPTTLRVHHPRARALHRASHRRITSVQRSRKIGLYRQKPARRLRRSTTLTSGTTVRFMAAVRLLPSPTSRASQRYLLPAGSRATALSQQGPWLYIRLPNGVRGYVQIRIG